MRAGCCPAHSAPPRARCSHATARATGAGLLLVLVLVLFLFLRIQFQFIVVFGIAFHFVRRAVPATLGNQQCLPSGLGGSQLRMHLAGRLQHRFVFFAPQAVQQLDDIVTNQRLCHSGSHRLRYLGGRQRLNSPAQSPLKIPIFLRRSRK